MGQKNLLYLYSGPRLEWQWATKAWHSFVILEWSWTEVIVLRKKVFVQALIESCVLAENHRSKSAIVKVVFDLGKYKLSSDYWKKWPLLKLFNFVKVVRNIEISNLEPKTIKCLFSKCFLKSHFILKLFPHTWHLYYYLYDYSYGKDI